MTTYQRLKDVREDRDLKQIDIAKVLGIKQTNYSRYERGIQMMGVDKYIILARFYNISVDYLLGLTDQPRTLDGSPYQVSKNITITQTGNGNKINIKN